MDFMNSEKFIFLWFGLWSIGAKPAFLNYNLSGRSLAHCIRVARTKLVLIDPEVEGNVTQDVRDGFPGTKFQVLTPKIVDEMMEIEEVRLPNEVRSTGAVSEIASLVYTSGTTGMPKPGIVSSLKTNLGASMCSSWMGAGPGDIYYTVSIPHTMSSPY